MRRLVREPERDAVLIVSAVAQAEGFKSIARRHGNVGTRGVAKMIGELHHLGYRVELVPTPSEDVL
jgi:hypothetical protein